MGEAKRAEDESAEMVDAEREDATRINDDVISTISGIVLSKIPGVITVSTGIVSGLLGRKATARGVRVESGENEVRVEVTVTVDYGVKIPEIASQIQTKVREAIEQMTGKFVRAVNVNVQGIRFPPAKESGVQPAKEPEAPPGAAE